MATAVLGGLYLWPPRTECQSYAVQTGWVRAMHWYNDGLQFEANGQLWLATGESVTMLNGTVRTWPIICRRLMDSPEESTAEWLFAKGRVVYVDFHNSGVP